MEQDERPEWDCGLSCVVFLFLFLSQLFRRRSL